MATPQFKPRSRRFQISFDKLDIYLAIALIGLVGAGIVAGFWIAVLVMGGVQ